MNIVNNTIQTVNNTVNVTVNTMNNTVASGVNLVRGIEKKGLELVSNLQTPRLPPQRPQKIEEAKFEAPKIDPNLEKEIFSSIPLLYFDTENDFDAVGYWLSKLPEKRDDLFIPNEIAKYEKALSFVTLKLTSTVITNYSKMGKIIYF